MGNNIKFQGFVFTIDAPTEYTGTPTSKNVVSHLDLISDVVSLNRLSGESAAEFKERVMDVAVHPGGGIYEGVINGLTRELGFSRQKAIKIELKLGSGGDPIARNPRVDILPNKVVLYSDHRDSIQTIDRTIRIYQPEDAGFYIEDLVTEINKSQCFSASIYSDVRHNWHSTNLIRGNTDVFIQNDVISSDRLTTLSTQNIIEESLVFDEPETFKTEVTTTPSAAGEYKIDRINGRIYTYNIPQGDLGVSYHAGTFPFIVDYSPIKVYSMQEDDFQYELFQHETLDSGEVANTLPNREGSEIFHQLYKENKTFWGE
jgi:hypothetical protein